MKNPLREMSRPKAVAIAGVIAGAVAVSGAAAAINVGLLTGNDSAPFTPQPVAATVDGAVSTTSTTEPPVEVVYQDVYERAAADPAPATATAAPAPVHSSSDDLDDQGEDRDDDTVTDDHDDDDDEDERHDAEDHDDEDHEVDDDGFDD